eukprot:jgi/Mesen1/5962/ME000301S05086
MAAMTTSIVASQLSSLSLGAAENAGDRSSVNCAVSAFVSRKSVASSASFCSGLPGFGASLSGARLACSNARSITAKPFTVRAVYADLEEDEEEETEEEITAAYEKMYGKAFSGIGHIAAIGDKDEEDIDEPGKKRRGRREGGDREERGGRRGKDSEFEERVVQVRRVTKVVKGGKQLAFRAVVVIGDKKGKVGVGVGKAKEVSFAVQKAVTDAKRHMITVPMTKYLTFPHRADGRYGAAKVMLRPAASGTGVIAGGSVRVVLELAGVENALGKEIGSGNPLNNARAVLEAISSMRQFKEVAAMRGMPMEELWK